MKIEASETIDRPPEVVFRFIGVEHLANHPRWDRGARLTIEVDVPGAPDPLDPLPIAANVRRMKELIEAER